MLRVTYTEIKLRQHEQLREAATHRLTNTTKSRQPRIRRFPAALSLRVDALRAAV